MTTELFKYLNVPNSCKIGKKLFKKQFIENFSLNVNEKKILSNEIDIITLEYLLTKENINISPYVDETYDYQEIAFVQVKIFKKNHLKKVATIIQHIPHPLIVLFTFDSEVCLNIAPKRINKSDNSKLVVEESLFTDWIDTRSLTPLEKEFIQNLEIQHQPFTDFFSFYKSYLDKITAFNASKYSGHLNTDEKTQEILEQIEVAELKINETISKIKKETNVRDKVTLNIKLQELKTALNKLKNEL